MEAPLSVEHREWSHMADGSTHEWIQEQVKAALGALGLKVESVPEENLKGLPTVYFGPAVGRYRRKPTRAPKRAAGTKLS